MGEYIGAYGSPMYHSTYKVNNVYTIDTTFLTARKIISLDNNQYLIIAEGPIRMRGSEWSYFEAAYLLQDNRIIRVCQFQLSHWIENSIGSNTFYPSVDKEIDSLENLIVYMPNKKILNCITYGYYEEEYIYDEILPCYKVTSSYKLTDNEFKLVRSDSTFDTRTFQ